MKNWKSSHLFRFIDLVTKQRIPNILFLDIALVAKYKYSPNKECKKFTSVSHNCDLVGKNKYM